MTSPMITGSFAEAMERVAVQRGAPLPPAPPSAGKWRKSRLFFWHGQEELNPAAQATLVAYLAGHARG